jgi:hypothetical protein
MSEFGDRNGGQQWPPEYDPPSFIAAGVNEIHPGPDAGSYAVDEYPPEILTNGDADAADALAGSDRTHDRLDDGQFDHDRLAFAQAVHPFWAASEVSEDHLEAFYDIYGDKSMARVWHPLEIARHRHDPVMLDEVGDIITDVQAALSAQASLSEAEASQSQRKIERLNLLKASLPVEKLCIAGSPVDVATAWSAYTTIVGQNSRQTLTGVDSFRSFVYALGLRHLALDNNPRLVMRLASPRQHSSYEAVRSSAHTLSIDTAGHRLPIQVLMRDRHVTVSPDVASLFYLKCFGMVLPAKHHGEQPRMLTTTRAIMLHELTTGTRDRRMDAATAAIARPIVSAMKRRANDFDPRLRTAL